MTTILLVDDDVHLLELTAIQLSSEGFSILKAKNGIEALDLLRHSRCDLAVVDVMMPFMDGYELTTEIRKQHGLPVILLTARSQLEDKEKGFLAGTDDYVAKPFEPKELVYRIKAVLRRYQHSPAEEAVKIGRIIVDKRNYEVHIQDKTILLPLKEFELLYFLASHPKQVFSREQLIEHIWGVDYEGDERTVDVHIKRLRERFSDLTNDFSIKTVRGIGYSLEAAST